MLKRLFALCLLCLSCVLVSSCNSSTTFQDDFSSEISGWDRLSADYATTDYSAGQYRILVNKSWFDMWSILLRRFTTPQVTVDVQMPDTTIDFSSGIICGYQSQTDFYAFFVGTHGDFSIEQMTMPGWVTLAQVFDPSLKMEANKVYQYTVNCGAGELSLSLNGQKILQIKPPETTPFGYVGLIASTRDQIAADVFFDNFIVK